MSWIESCCVRALQLVLTAALGLSTSTNRSVQHSHATQRKSGWWLRHGFKIKVVHARLDLRDAETAHAVLPRLYGDRARAFLMTAHPAMPELKLGLYHVAKAPA